jgi:hypothetical protein
MENDRRVVLNLVAAGRLTPADAERLLIAWNDWRERLWAIAACAGFALLVQFNPQAWLTGLLHTAHSLLPVSAEPVHRAVWLLTHLLRGAL